MGSRTEGCLRDPRLDFEDRVV